MLGFFSLFLITSTIYHSTGLRIFSSWRLTHIFKNFCSLLQVSIFIGRPITSVFVIHGNECHPKWCKHVQIKWMTKWMTAIGVFLNVFTEFSDKNIFITVKGLEIATSYVRVWTHRASSVKWLMQVYGDTWKPILEHHNAFQWDIDAWRSTWRSVCSPLKRPGCYHSTSKTQVEERILKLSPIHASAIYQIPWIR